MKFSRLFKNTVMILMIAVLGVGITLSTNYISKQSAAQSRPSFSQTGDFGGKQNKMQDKQQGMPDAGTQQQDAPPAMPEGDGNQQQNAPPAMPEGENNNTQLSMPAEQAAGDLQTPDGESRRKGSDEKSADRGTRPDTFFYLLLAAEWIELMALIIYLIMSEFNKKGLHATFHSMKALLIYGLCAAIIGTAFGVANAEAAGRIGIAGNNDTRQSVAGNQENSVTASGALTMDATEETLTESYSATESDESAVLVSGGSTVTIQNATVTKTGDSTNTENSEFYGVNAAVLVQESSTATINDTEITTDAKGANAVFATGTDAKIYLSNTTITTTGASSSRGLDATYGGYIEADNVTITTQGGSCATLATDRGEGTVIVKNSKLETNGSGSPVIYSTGDIQIDNTTGTANGSQMVVIEGKNAATVTNSTLTASGKGNRNDADHAGIMIYQSMSGDAGEGTGTFTATDSSLSIQKDSDYYTIAPMFFVTNTDAVINLTNTTLDFGSGVLISAKGTDEWGKSGANGGNVTLNATNQTLTGNVVADNLSAVTLNLTGSSYEGTINGDNTAQSVTLTLDAASTIKLTGDTYVTALTDADSTYANIDFNGYTLYVNGKAVN